MVILSRLPTTTRARDCLTQGGGPVEQGREQGPVAGGWRLQPPGAVSRQGAGDAKQGQERPGQGQARPRARPARGQGQGQDLRRILPITTRGRGCLALAPAQGRGQGENLPRILPTTTHGAEGKVRGEAGRKARAPPPSSSFSPYPCPCPSSSPLAAAPSSSPPWYSSFAM